MEILEHALGQTLMISAFVLAMMMLVEYLNVRSGGWLRERLQKSGWQQYLLAAFLGATPGCLGAYTAVALFAHRSMSLGALIAAMIATSGDEAFVLFARIPREALLLTGFLFVLGIVTGVLSDRLLGGVARRWLSPCTELEIHEHEDSCDCHPWADFLSNLRRPSFPRALLLLGTALVVLGLLTGFLGHGHEGHWSWERISFLVIALPMFWILLCVPDHFLEEHLWKHVIRGHFPALFLWTLGTLLALEFFFAEPNLALWASARPGLLAGLAALLGLVPESGPHLIFVNGYAEGLFPFSALLVSSIVQDGHGMLPLLAESRRAFFLVKGVNLFAGLLAGAALLLFGG
ncbi:MAG: putative manganese transporter [Candidatus Krumholzibacteria bacterium]|jgi:hypothetical protein|nr:putative manganese transporter [Candidatus Krumholzibacteria bacterium]MDP6669507.1 putative manganese transporter [Candidatus Krumholzibacteria bacterium]MDP6798155.1 putative manganese transporter [Candidatus Krumholzibacteria bacterium]MDP7021998.1 putative manganese transporter [Candidatus Krumholzibacteria bacterium]